jgi:tetratricopeptide (TPR) repeat protein
VALGFALLAPRRPALAAPEDASVSSAVDKILEEDYADANFGDARKKLKALADRCKKSGCSGQVIGQLQVALGMVAVQINRNEEAKTAFVTALEADPSAALPKDGVTDAIKARFAEARKAWESQHPKVEDVAGADWANKQALDLAVQAQAAEAQGNFTDCIQRARAALALEEQARGRLALAVCEQRAGKILDAIRDAQKALEAAIAKKDAALARAAQQRIAELLPRLAHVNFQTTQAVGDLKVTFDERPIPTDKLTQQFAIDPGAHRTHAEGSIQGILMAFDQQLDVKEGENVTVQIKLKPTALTPGQLQCMLQAKTEQEILNCFPKNESTLVVRAGADVSGYTDSTSVSVLSPSVNASVNSPTAGWNLGASYLVDVVTAASPDIVSEASRRFHDTRQAVSANGGYKPGQFGGQLHGNFSTEHDYVSRSIGGAVSGDFLEKQVTPQLGYTYSLDTIGRAGTPFDVFSNELTTHEVQAGATIVVSPVSLFVVGGTMTVERGDQSKPYRYVPMFDANTFVPVGASINFVNDNRLPIRPLEQLPTARERYALAARYALRVGGRATLRLEERAYIDTWDIKATTTDLRYIIDTSRRLRVWPHLHLHAQTAASFYARTYVAIAQPTRTDGSILIPTYRTDDRELSPFVSGTGGGGARLSLSAPEAKFQYGVSFQVDAMYSRYFDALFLKSRIAYYGTLGFDVEFQ